jgi:hypothetical protein
MENQEEKDQLLVEVRRISGTSRCAEVIAASSDPRVIVAVVNAITDAIGSDTNRAYGPA